VVALVYIHMLPANTASIAIYIGEAGDGYTASLLWRPSRWQVHRPNYSGLFAKYS